MLPVRSRTGSNLKPISPIYCLKFQVLVTAGQTIGGSEFTGQAEIFRKGGSAARSERYATDSFPVLVHRHYQRKQHQSPAWTFKPTSDAFNLIKINKTSIALALSP